MTKRELQKIKSVLTKAIKAHLKKGGKLIADDYYLGGVVKDNGNNHLANMCKCPVQIVTDNMTIRGKEAKGKERRVSTADEFSKAVGFTVYRDTMNAIIAGYDKRNLKESSNWTTLLPVTYKALYAIGYNLRKEFKPLTKTQINKIMGYQYV